MTRRKITQARLTASDVSKRRNRSAFSRVLTKALGMLGASAVLASSLVITTDVVAPTAAHALAPLQCDGSKVYLQRGGSIDEFDVLTGQRTQDVITGMQNNGLGITNGGEVVYSIENTGGTGSKEIRYQIRATGQVGSRTLSPGIASLVRGGVNPVNDIYYFTGAGAPQQLGMYRAPSPGVSEIAPTIVATISGIPHNANGDLAFSAGGSLILLANNIIYTIEGEIPSDPNAEPVQLEAKVIKTLPDDVEGNGIAFANNGNFFVSTSDNIQEVNPATGETVRNVPYAGARFGDLASCSYPNTLLLQKNLQTDRLNPSDQFEISIGGQDYIGSDAGVVVATTSGNEKGLQSSSAGPEFVFQGHNFELAEQAAGTTDMRLYYQSASCIEAGTETPVPATETSPGNWSVDYPSGLLSGADVVCTINNEAHRPAIELTKTTDQQEYGVGDVITYSFRAENTGNVPLTGVTIEDELEGLSELTNFVWPGAPNELQPGESVTAEAVLTVTQTHIDTGSIENTANVTGTPPVGEDVTDSSTVTVPFTPTPKIELEKTTDLSAPYAVGDTIEYEFVATNTGNVTLSDVAIADPLPGLSGVTYDWSQATGEGILAPGDQVRATATLTVTQTHVDAGLVENTATAVGTPPTGEAVKDTSTVDVPFEGNPSIELTKSTDLSGDYNLGDTVTYSFVAENTGNVTLTDVTITDPLPGLSNLTYNWDDAAEEGTLQPGDTVKATGTLTITQEHLDRGWVQNTATVKGTPPVGPEVSDSSSVTINANIAPSVGLVKTGVLDGVAAVGETVSYSFVVTNTGNVTLTDVTVTDPLPGLSDLVFDWSGAVGEGVLEPGQQVMATATYVLTQADVDAGSVVNLATGVGTPPAVTDPEDPSAPPVVSDPVEDTDPETVTLPQEPALQLVKRGSLSETGESAAVGDEVVFTFEARNIGNVTLTDVTVTDPLPGLSDLVFDWSDAVGEGVLEPGEKVTATATYALTQADIDAGHVANTGSVTGTPPTTDPEDPATPLPPVEDEVIVPVPAAPSIDLVKTSELRGEAGVGSVVDYTFVATNTGNVTLTDVTVTDPLPGLSDLSYDWDGASTVGSLRPGEQVTVSASLVLTQELIDAGWVKNTATVGGTPPDVFDPENPDEPRPADPVEDDSTVVTELPAAPSIDLVKTSELRGDVGVGSVVDYTFVATNTGNVTLTDVTVTDPLPGLSDLVFDWSGAVGEGVLEPGEQVTASASLVLTQELIDAGWVKNTATVGGTPPDVFDPEDPTAPPVPGDPVTGDSTVVTELPAAPSIGLVKSGVLDGVAAVGETVSYSFVVTNTGNVTLTDVTVTDPLPGLSDLVFDWSGAVGEGVLEPGQQVMASATYVLTQADVDAGSVVNLATGVGTPPAVTDPEDPSAPPVVSAPVEDTDPETVTLPQEPALQLVKRGSLSETGESAAVGDEVVFTFEARNIGNVTLTDVTVTDPLPGLSDLVFDWSDAVGEGVLEPGERVTATATYALTQADIDAGHVANTGSVTGTPPTTDPEDPATPLPPVEDEVIVPVPAAPSIDLVKTSELRGDVGVGSVVDYTFVATNTGNVTLTDVTVTDPLPGLSDLSYDWDGASTVGSLRPGEQVTVSASLVLTQELIDAGWVKNTATVGGTPPDVFDPENPDEPRPADPVEDDSTVVTELPAAPSIDLVKTARVHGEGVAGDLITYTLVATNTGNVTLSNVVITDALKGLSVLRYDWSKATAEGVLAPGERVTATATYVITEADANAGKVMNTATAEGTPPGATDPGVPSKPVSAEVTVTTRVGALPETGSQLGLWTMGIGGVMAAAGIMLMRRNRKHPIA